MTADYILGFAVLFAFFTSAYVLRQILDESRKQTDILLMVLESLDEPEGPTPST